MRCSWLSVLVVLGLLAGCGGSSSADGAMAEPAVTVQEEQCRTAGWQRLVVPAAGLQRLVLWKAPPSGNGAWTRGAIVVLHGGGGSHTNFCVANVALIQAQVRFTEAALAQGFAVFLLDSHDQITDEAGRLCGKVWDDEVRSRANIDLPFIEELLLRAVPARRPVGSSGQVFMTGLSSGGFMTVRAATRFGEHVAAFAPVASGDPYGWFRDCTHRPGDRANVAGVGMDRETQRPISEPGACNAAAYPNERPWDGAAVTHKPPFRVFHHAGDGVLDRSCVEKQRQQLSARGYPETAPFTLSGSVRSVDVHYWQDDYNAPLLAWFASFTR